MPPDPVTVNLNGVDVPAVPGQMLIDLAEAHSIFIPRFCYHPGMASVAACRMCLVEVEGQRKLLPACATPVAEGMVARTHSPAAVQAQRSVLELLLINHPLDCPICDRGGECPLQDQALTHGPGSSRYHEPKRHFKKALPLSELVVLDRERCVLCWRCVRFCREVSGDKEIELLDRGSLSQINRGPAEPFDSHFSGNTIQICPVGALTSKPYRFLSRPWDLLTTATVCSFCSVGCPLSVERRGQEVLRAQALPNASVNGFWNCDKGRYGHRYVSAPDRLGAPLLRCPPPAPQVGGPPAAPGDSFEEATWGEALDTVSEVLAQTIALYGKESVGFIGGAHATNEDLYAASVLFRDTIGTPNLDFRTFDASFDYAAFRQGGVVGSSARIDDLDRAQTILWFGPDPKEELPVLYLRLRQAAQKGARLLVAHPRHISLCDFGTHLAYTPGRELELVRALSGASPDAGGCGVAAEPLRVAVDALAAQRVVVGVGQQFPGRRCPEAWEALAAWIASPQAGGRASVLLAVPNANSQGALDFGISPGLAAGHRPAPAGLGTLEMLQGAVDGRIKFLWLMGADLLSDLPDAVLAGEALRSGAYVVVSELFPTPTALLADVVLPAAAFAEKEGSFTNLERRVQKVNAVVAAPGGARADWHILSDLAGRLGHPRVWTSARQVAEEIARSVPTHAGYDWEHLGDRWAPVAGPPDMPPELWHPAGESGPLPAYRGATSQEPGDGHPNLPDRRFTTSWPLRWELRAVDATLRPGWVWPAAAGAATSDDSGAPGAPAAASGSAQPAAPRAPEGWLMLLAERAIYDAGAMISRAPDLRSLTPQPYAEMHPDEAAARGLAPGTEIWVASARGAVQATLRCSTGTPPGAVHMLYDQPGLQTNVLLDAADEATFVEVSA